MLKVDEEGQIEEDGADRQVSHSRSSNEGRPIPLADRLMPLSDASSKKTGTGAPSSSTNNGYVSPRHGNLERERDRDRYHESSPGPSSASSYAPPRSRFGYPAELGTPYNAASSYPYRESSRGEPFASGSRASFSGPASRGEPRREWYPASSTPTRGPDTYRPGAARERERERDWDSFRDGDRDREWADRERDPYRDTVDKRRDWPQRDRGAPPSSYDMADTHSSYAPSAGRQYSREFPGRRPSSPPAHLGRDRDFDADRIRDRDRDPRMRGATSGWTGATGMRQWGKPSDAGWENRSSRRPASDDARSDTSHRQSGPRSNNSPPHAASSEPGARLVGSDNASERSGPRSRDLSPQPARSPERIVLVDQATDNAVHDSEEVKEEPQKQGDAPREDKKGVADEMAEDKESDSNAKIETVQEEEDRADDAGQSTQTDVDAAQETQSTTAVAAEIPTTEARPDEVIGEEASSATKDAASQQSEPTEQAPEVSLDPAPAEAKTDEPTSQIAQEQEINIPQPSSEFEAKTVASPAPVPAESSIEEPSATETASMPTTGSQAQATEAELKAPTSSIMEVPPAVESVDEKAEVETSSQAPAPVLEVNSSDVAKEGGQSNLSAATAASELPGPPIVLEHADDPMQGKPEESPQSTSQFEAPKEEVETSQTVLPTKETVPDETATETPMVTVGDATSSVDGASAPAPIEVSSTETDGLEISASTEVIAETPVPDVAVSSKSTEDDADMSDAAPVKVQEPKEPESLSTSATLASEAEKSAQQPEEPKRSATPNALEAADTIQNSEAPTTIETATSDMQQDDAAATEPAEVSDDIVQPHVESIQDQVQTAQLEAALPETQPTKAPAVESTESTNLQPAQTEEPAQQEAAPVPVEQNQPSVEESIKTEEAADATSGDVEMPDLPVESKALDEPMTEAPPEDKPDQPSLANEATDIEDRAATLSSTDAPVAQPELPKTTSLEAEISGPNVSSAIDKENQTHEITIPQVDYGDDKEAQALVEQEEARIEEVEMPATDQSGQSLRLAEIDEVATNSVEPPLMTPTTKEQIDRAIQFAVKAHIVNASAKQDDWKRILRENQRISQLTTMDVLKAKIHGIPQIVSSAQPLWLDQEDKLAEKTKSKLFNQLLDRKKRLNEKIEGLKKRYRSINEEWKVHCSRLDRIAERREMLRRPPTTTPAGTPGVFGVEDPSPGAAGGGLLGASLTTGRANRRNAQTGFAGFGDAVRSEAEFLEILASLENADMQDPNMRAARTTATAPDMYIDPDSDRLMKLRYDDINGFVADPLGFYLDKFDPDVWSEEEKAIFARRYALWPKQFGKIAQALPHKTPQQCVRYYYLNKKLPGNDFKALAAARNRERKRKARGKPKKAKGSALMADLKSAKGEEVDDVEDGSGVRSPSEAADSTDIPAPSSGRKGGRARMVSALVDSVADSAEDMPAGRKRTAEQSESDVNTGEAKASDKRRSGPKSKRAKSDSASGADKSRKPKTSLKKDNAAAEEAKAGIPPVPAVPKMEAPDATRIAPEGAPGSVEVKARVEDSDLAAAEALGALAGLFGGPAAGDAYQSSSLSASGSDPSLLQMPGELDADGRKAGKKRRSKTGAPGEEGVEVTHKGRGKQATSSYWSVAERSEFLRALVVHGPRWEVVSSTLAQKSAAQARNYFARNENEIDFAEAAALARSHADLPQAEREAAALAFVRQRFAASNAGPGMPSMLTSGVPVSGFGAEAASAVSRTPHLPPPPGITAGQAEMVDVKMREGSPEPTVSRRGLQINSLLNDSDDAGSTRAQRRSSLYDSQTERREFAHLGHGRDASVPPGLYARHAIDLDGRPSTGDRIDPARPLSSDGRSMRDSLEERARMYERTEPQHVRDLREREEGGEGRSWMYESPYESHRRPSPSPGYAPMAPPSHPHERGMPPVSRYSMPPGSAGHVARSVPPMPSHLHPSAEAELDREHERERSGYGLYPGLGRGREHESHSMPPAVSGESHSATSAGFGYGRYAGPGVGSLYPSSTSAATASLASRGRPTSGPLTAPLPSSSDRPAYEQRWQKYSQSPGPSATPPTSAAHGGAAGFSTGSAYRSSQSPYSSFPSQSLPRPSLPSLSASGGKVGAPHLPSLGAVGRSLPPILGSFPAPGRGLGAAARQGEEPASRYWPYPARPRGPNDHPPSNRE